MTNGKVYLVGAGPGDPSLITLKAAEILRKADVVVYDRLVNEALLNLAPENALKIYVGKEPGRHEISQEEITNRLIHSASQGKTVVRLKGGDPFLFGRGGEEAEALAASGVPFEVVPGVTSALAAPAYAGIPITHRQYASSVVIVTGHSGAENAKPVNWEKLARCADTIVILMGLEALAETVKKLLAGGLNPETPAAIIEWGTTSRQKVVTCTTEDLAKTAKEKNVMPPAVVVIGEVVKLGSKLAWFKPDIP
jgi:uroporphyrin-III C-methyltransferase